MLEEQELMMALITEYLNDVRTKKKKKRREEKRINDRGQTISKQGKPVAVMDIFCKISIKSDA